MSGMAYFMGNVRKDSPGGGVKCPHAEPMRSRYCYCISVCPSVKNYCAGHPSTNSILAFFTPTRRKAKFDVSPPGYPPSRLLQRPPCTTAACSPTCTTSLVCYRHLANIAETQILSFIAELNCVDQNTKRGLPQQRPLREQNKN